MLTKDKLIFDEAELGSSDQVGAHILGTANEKISSTNVGGKEGLDVNVINAVEVSATDLDIRDLSFATDKVDVSGSEVSLDATTLAALENITVSATDLDIRDLAFATDSVTAHQGGTWTIDSITNAVTVTATDLDIRNLDYSQDNLAIKGATGNQLVVEADGSINVNADISVVNGHEKEEDTAHTTGDIGSFMLAVRQDSLSSLVSADGDYAGLKVDSLGRLWTSASVSSGVADDAADTENPLKVGSRAVDGALTAISASGDKANVISDMYRRVYVNTAPNVGFKTSAATVGLTAAELVSSPLLGRTRIMIQNLGNKEIFIGFDNTVTSANGLRVSAGAFLEMPFGEDLDIWAIGAAAGLDVRIVEIA